ncbi:MAG: hypothetical protein AAGD22_12220 [Verrucomicrobiota bacterium]
MAGLWMWISSCLIVNIWLRHTWARLRLRTFWTIIVLIPILGWIFYAGFFRVPKATNINNQSSSYAVGGD